MIRRLLIDATRLALRVVLATYPAGFRSRYARQILTHVTRELTQAATAGAVLATATLGSGLQSGICLWCTPHTGASVRGRVAGLPVGIVAHGALVYSHIDREGTVGYCSHGTRWNAGFGTPPIG